MVSIKVFSVSSPLTIFRLIYDSHRTLIIEIEPRMVKIFPIVLFHIKIFNQFTHDEFPRIDICSMSKQMILLYKYQILYNSCAIKDYI